MSTCLLIFAKVPRPGHVKTRLIPFVSAPNAAKLHQQMVYNTVISAVNSSVSEIQLYCSPHIHFPVFFDLKRKFNIQCISQSGANLGDKMANAAASAFKKHSKIVIIGTDCPQISGHVIDSAFSKLNQGNDAVIHPTLDGGYALIGLNKFNRMIFSDINWGSSSVMQETKSKLVDLNWNWDQLETLWDVDRPIDLIRFRRSKFRYRIKSLFR